MACKLSDLTDRSDQSYMDDKRGASQDEFVLERVQGLTSTALHSLASNPVNGWVAFPAACVLVLLDPKTNEQKFIESPSLRNISCCAFTDDGRFVAFGETGMKPHIAMWNLREHRECHKFVVDSSVRAMFFHPMSTIIISLGLKENLIVVWDYVKGVRLAACKWQTMPLSLTIPRTGCSLVVCGHRKITLFNISKVNSHSYETNVFQDRKTVLLGKQSEYTFVDVESGRGQYEKIVYTVTSCGYLCEIKLGDILIDKALKVDTQTFCIRYSTELLFVGCTAGVVKICDPANLTVTAAVSLSNLLGPSAMPKVGNKCYLDVCTLVVDEIDKIVTCVYADCSMHSWQIGTDGQKIVCSAIEPAAGANDVSEQNASKSNLLRSFIGCCEKTKSCNEVLSKCSFIEQNKPPQQYGGRCLVNENRASHQNVNAVRFTPDGKDVICGNEEGEIRVYELSTGILRRVIEAHSSQVTCIELMYDNEFQLVCSGGRDRVMFVLDARNDFSLVQVLCDHSAAIIAISMVNHKGVLTLVSAAADNVILIRRAILGGTLRFTITGEIAQTNCSRSFFVTSDFIALGGKDSQIKVFKADPVFQSKPVKTINCQKLCPTNTGFKAIDIDPSSSFMAVSQCNGNISVYHLQTGQPVASLPLQSDITKIHFTKDLKYMISSTSNGCDLVWRLPERMTEFMQSKQDKIYHIETSKEVTSETYMSCVKVCKEEVDGEEYTADASGFKDNEEESTGPICHEMKYKTTQALRQQHRSSSSGRSRVGVTTTNISIGKENFHLGHIAQNSSNHNSEWDRTPSIDSMSLLDEYRSPMKTPDFIEEDREDDDGKICSSCSESILNCSTCTHSVSTTTHTSCCSVDATESSISAMQGRNEHSQQLRFYCGPDHDLFGQVMENGQCMKLGPFRENFNSASGIMPPLNISQQESRPMSGEEIEIEYDFQHHDKLDSPKELSKGCVKEKLDEKHEDGQNKPMIQLDQTQAASPMSDPHSSNKAESKLGENCPKTKETEDEEGQGLKKDQGEIELPSKMTHKVSPNSGDFELATSPSQDQRHPKSKNILEKTLFYEGVMRGDLKSFNCSLRSSPTRQHTIAVGEAVKYASRPKSGDFRQPDFKDAKSLKCFKKTCVDAEDGLHWTPLTTPDYSNTSSNITNLVPNSSSTMLDFCKYGKTNDAEISPSHKTNKTEADVESTLTLTECGDPTLRSQRVIPHDDDITRPEEESIRSNLEEKITVAEKSFEDHVVHNNSAACHVEQSEKAGDDDEDDNQILDLSINLGNMNLNSDVQVADKRKPETLNIEHIAISFKNEVDEKPNSKQDLKNLIPSANDVENNRSEAASNFCVEDEKVGAASNEEESEDRRQTVLDQLEQEGFTIPEKYRSALRSCMQLSNSQETFATLRVDTNDMELMAFLSHALKKKLVAAGLIGLSCNEIESLLKSGSQATETKDPLNAVGEVTDTAWSAKKTLTKKEHKNILESLNQNASPLSNLNGELNNEAGSIENQEKIDRSNVNVSAATDKDDCWTHEDENSCAEPRKLHSISFRRSTSPLTDAKRKMYKTIMSKLPRAWKSNKNRSNLEAKLEMSEMHSFLQANMDDNDFNNLAYSDTYLEIDCSEEGQILQAESASSENCSRVIKSLECFDERSVKTYRFSPTKKLAQNSDKQSHTFRKQCIRSPVNRSVQRSSPRDRGKGLNQGRLSPVKKGNNLCKAGAKLDAVKAISRSSSSPGTGLCRRLHGSEYAPLSGEIDRRSFHSPPQWLVPAGSPCRGEAMGGETDHSRTESFVSAVSRDIYLERCSESDSGVDAGFSREKPMVEIFRDQDEYLRKLKEVRENFERSIQALSAERKSRQAAEGRGRGFARK